MKECRHNNIISYKNEESVWLDIHHNGGVFQIPHQTGNIILELYCIDCNEKIKVIKCNK